MDIFTVIKKDHRAVQKLLEELTETTERAAKKRASLFKEITEELLAHSQAEEEIFYPKLQSDRDERVMIFEAKDEHALATQTLQELATMEPTTEEWTAKASLLKDLVDHHIKEEEGEIYPTAKQEIDRETQVELGTQFLELKEKFKTEIQQQSVEMKKAS